MKPRGANKRSRLLCPICAEVKKVQSIEDGQITLICGHLRQQILPVRPGCISIEDLRTSKGRRLFPVNREAELPSNRW